MTARRPVLGRKILHRARRESSERWEGGRAHLVSPGLEVFWKAASQGLRRCGGLGVCCVMWMDVVREERRDSESEVRDTRGSRCEASELRVDSQDASVDFSGLPDPNLSAPSVYQIILSVLPPASLAVSVRARATLIPGFGHLVCPLKRAPESLSWAIYPSSAGIVMASTSHVHAADRRTYRYYVDSRQERKQHARSPQETTHTTPKNNPIVAFACPDRRAVVRSSMTRSGRSSPLAATHPSHADLRLIRSAT
ncbi:hypothetical protein BKA56DRAFT_612846 [Ilyonectria sp. MPI-CAGE-AT-0026]|nr:hypothetical protein BKA56DRAFT_612846 [Ilyonectria sp. MPI-CAGE-AT-0026]